MISITAVRDGQLIVRMCATDGCASASSHASTYYCASCAEARWAEAHAKPVVYSSYIPEEWGEVD